MTVLNTAKFSQICNALDLGAPGSVSRDFLSTLSDSQLVYISRCLPKIDPVELIGLLSGSPDGVCPWDSRTDLLSGIRVLQTETPEIFTAGFSINELLHLARIAAQQGAQAVKEVKFVASHFLVEQRNPLSLSNC